MTRVKPLKDVFFRGKCNITLKDVHIPLEIEQHKFCGENPKIKGKLHSVQNRYDICNPFSGIHVETPVHISMQLFGVGPFNKFIEMLIKDDLKKISIKIVETKLDWILENVMTKISIIDQLYVNVAE